MKKFLILLGLLVSLNTQAQEIKVLFFGNSITASGIPEILKELALKGGDSIHVEHYWGGQLLREYVQDEAMKENTRIRIAENKWDYVVLQENSQVSGFYPGWNQGYFEYYSYEAAMLLNELIRAGENCTETMFFMTYGYLNGDTINFPGDTYEKQQNRIKRNYMLLADSSSSEVAPVGWAWRKVRNEQPWGDELYIPGDHHPSEMGAYLAGCVFYCAILKKSPVGISYYGMVEEEKAIELQKAAAGIVLDDPDSWNIGINKPDAGFLEQHFDKTVLLFSESRSKYASHLYDFGDGTSSSKKHPEHEYNDYGTYTIKHYVYNDCGEVDSQSIEITLEETNIEEKEFKNIRIYPMPVNNILNIEGISQSFNYSLFSLDGKSIISGMGNRNATIKTTKLEKGIYILHLQTKKSSISYKIIK